VSVAWCFDSALTYYTPVRSHHVRTLACPAVVVLGQDQVEYNAEEGRDVLRRIDWHILPMLMWVYCIQFADKISLNFASLMGIRTDVHLDPNSQQYSWASSIFYAGYIAWE
jgi:ACS family allantoate permease-like MFS transporter